MSYPILEFDPAPEAMIEPSQVIKEKLYFGWLPTLALAFELSARKVIEINVFP